MQKYLTNTILSIILISISIYRNYEDNLITSVLFYVILGTTAIILVHHILSSKKHSTNKANHQIVYYSVWFIAFGIVGIIYYYFNYKRSISDLIVASSDLGMTRTQLNLKSDKSYVLMNSTFLGKSYTYGSYSANKDTIIIDKIPKNSSIETNTFIITNDSFGYRQFEQLSYKSNQIDTGLIKLTFHN